MSVDAAAPWGPDASGAGAPCPVDPPEEAPRVLASEPFVPTLPPRVPVAPPAVVPPVVVADAIPRAAVARPSQRPPSPWRHTVARSVVLIAVGAAAVAVLYLLVQGFRSYDDLPAYDTAAPSYGTAVVDISTGDAASARTIRLTADSAGTHWRMDISGADVDGALQSDGTNVWVADGLGGWTWAAAPPDLLWMGRTYGRVLTYSDVVPSEARRYFEVLDRSDVVIDGRPVERIELAVAERRFAAENPSAHDAWLGGGDGVDAPEVAGLVLHVDENGVVWQFASGSDASATRFEVTLVSFDPAPFVLDTPIPLPPGGAASSPVGP